MGVGATIDYEADAVVRAPRWMTRNGLEWVYRITTEPKRYWRRYLRDMEFFWLVFLDGLGLYLSARLSQGRRMIRTAMVGLGKMGLSHLAIVRAHPHVDLVVACDTTAYLTDILGKYAGLPCYDDFDRMLEREQLDAVVVSTPSTLHAPMVRRHSTAACTSSARSRSCSTSRRARTRLARARQVARQPGRLSLPLRRRVQGSGASSTRERSARPSRSRRSLRARSCCDPRAHVADEKNEGGGRCTTTRATRSTSSTSSSARRPRDGVARNKRLLARRRRRGLLVASSTPTGRPASSASTGATRAFARCRRRSASGAATAGVTADRQECQLFLREPHARARWRASRLDRALHDRADRRGLVLPARRGILGAGRLLRRAVKAGRSTASGRPSPRPWRPLISWSRDARRGRRAALRRRPWQPGRRRERRRPFEAFHCSSPRTPMDRVLFGDNQFFGVNHMSEEKARAQVDALPGRGAIIDVLDAAYDEGIRTFMCTTHERIARDLRSLPRHPDKYRDFDFYPCMPYAHKYANAVTEHGMLGALGRFLPEGNGWAPLLKGGSRWRRGRTSRALRELLIDAEMKMFHGLRRRSFLCRTCVTDLLLGLGSMSAFRIFPTTFGPLRDQAEPGFITMNCRACSLSLERARASTIRSSAPTSTRSASGCAAACRLTRTRSPSAASGRRHVGAGQRRVAAAGGDCLCVRAISAASSRSCSGHRDAGTSARRMRSSAS